MTPVRSSQPKLDWKMNAKHYSRKWRFLVNFTSRKRWRSRSKPCIILPQHSVLYHRHYPNALCSEGSNNLKLYLEWNVMTTVSVWLKLVPLFYFFHHSRDSKKTVTLHTRYCLLQLKKQTNNFWRGEMGGLVCKFSGCSVTLSRNCQGEYSGH